MKRFYKSVSVTVDNLIHLDNRAVKTPGKRPLALPTRQLAEAIAEEWSAQAEHIRPETMRLTGLANAAIDILSSDYDRFTQGLVAYADGDLLCYRADNQPALIERQAAQWDPLLDWASRRFDVNFVKVSGIMHQSQPEPTCQRLAHALLANSPFALVALSQIITISGSLVIGLAVQEQQIDAEQAFILGHLDELYQAEEWGEDWMAADARALRREDFLSACRFLRLLDD
jgi:chaperone required for assembly of F1-ATPase